MKKQSGFTLAEMLIAFGIISILVGAALISLKPFENNIKYLYSATYQNLDTVLYNAVTDFVPQDRANNDPFSADITDDDEAAIRLCTALTHYITSVGGTCSANTVGTEANDDDFTSENVKFITTNGVRYWISPRTRGSNGTGPYFFIIFADMNGEKRPNSVWYERGVRDPDIFAFAALDMGRICPLGPPEVDSRFLTTRIMHRNASGDLVYSATSQEYIKSKAEAWGYYLPDGKYPSDIKNRALEEKEYMEEAPLSYNGYVRATIYNNNQRKDSRIYSSFLRNGQNMRVYFQNNFPDVNLQKDNLGCWYYSPDDCDINVDKYIW